MDFQKPGLNFGIMIGTYIGKNILKYNTNSLIIWRL